MKINELMSGIADQPFQTSLQNQTDFSHWLNDLMEHRTQKNTGDDYYWQHQDQLQQSNVHFDAQFCENQPRKSLMNNHGDSTVDTSSQQQTTPQIHFINQINPTNHPTLNVKETATKWFDQFSTELAVALKKSTLPDKLNIIQPRVTVQDTVQSETNEYFSHPVQFKNNHIFIEGDYADLSLNLTTLNKQEQKELIQLIQEQLKKKGFLLRRLIINGVKND